MLAQAIFNLLTKSGIPFRRTIMLNVILVAIIMEELIKYKQ
jgi:hypothetical protein